MKDLAAAASSPHRRFAGIVAAAVVAFVAARLTAEPSAAFALDFDVVSPWIRESEDAARTLTLTPFDDVADGRWRPIGQWSLGLGAGTPPDLDALRAGNLWTRALAAAFMAVGVGLAMRSAIAAWVAGLAFAIHPSVVGTLASVTSRHIDASVVLFSVACALRALFRRSSSAFVEVVPGLLAGAAALCHPIGVPLGFLHAGLVAADPVEGRRVSERRRCGSVALLAVATGTLAVVWVIGRTLPHDVPPGATAHVAGVARGFVSFLVPVGAWIHDGPIRFVDAVGPGLLLGLSVILVRGRRHPAAARVVPVFVALACWLAVAAMILPPGLVLSPAEVAAVLVPVCGAVVGFGATLPRALPLAGASIVAVAWLWLSIRRLDEAGDPVRVLEHSVRVDWENPVPRRFLAELHRAGQVPAENVSAEFASVDALFGVDGAPLPALRWAVLDRVGSLAVATGDLRGAEEAVDALGGLREAAGAMLERSGVGDLSARRTIAGAALAAGRLDRARVEAESLLSAYPRDAEGRVLLARVLALQSLSEAASEGAAGVAARESVNRAVVLLTAAGEAASESVDRARPGTAERGRCMATEVDAGRLLVAVLLRAAWRRDAVIEATAASDRLVRRRPEFPGTWMCRGELLAVVAPEDAGEAFRRAAAAAPAKAEPLLAFADWAASRGRMREALDALEKALVLEPHVPSVRMKVADFHVAVARRQIEAGGQDGLVRARAALDRARACAPDAAEVACVLGLWHEARSEWTAAKSAFETAHAKDPASLDVRGGLARALQREGLAVLGASGIDGLGAAGRRAAAGVLFRRAIELAPDSEDLAFARRSVAAWNREESLEPLVVEAEKARARKDWRAAVVLLDRARGYGALLPKEWALLGHCRAETGDVDGAIAAFSSVLAVEATSMQAHNMLARLYARRGDRVAAARHAATFIKIASQEDDPDGFLASEITAIRVLLSAPESR